MFSNIVNKSHEIINNIDNKSIAIDMTLGNGHDSLFLSNIFNKVYSFDIQDLAIRRSKERLKDCSNVYIYHDSFINFDIYINTKVNLFLYNLGFLPGSNKRITTNASDVIKSLEKAFLFLDSNSIIIICAYTRHEGGLVEFNTIFEYLTKLNNIDFHIYEDELTGDKLIYIKNK